MMTRNRVDLMGRLGQDPTQALTKTGKVVAHINIATNQVYYDKDKKRQELTHWHRCTAFGPVAVTILKYAKKGMFVAIEGELRPSEYVDKDGITRYPVTIKVNTINMDLPKKETHIVEDAPADEEDVAETTTEAVAAETPKDVF